MLRFVPRQTNSSSNRNRNTNAHTLEIRHPAAVKIKSDGHRTSAGRCAGEASEKKTSGNRSLNYGQIC